MKTAFAAIGALLSCLLLTVVARYALAHGPTPQKVDESIEISATPDAVWTLAGDFGRLAEWHPGVANCTAGGASPKEATREIELKSGGIISESVDDLNEVEHSVGYRLAKENIEALPVSFYSASLKVVPAGEGKSKVEWSGRFYRGDTGNFPPENLNDEAAVKAMTAFFRQGLEGLKAKLEAKG